MGFCCGRCTFKAHRGNNIEVGRDQSPGSDNFHIHSACSQLTSYMFSLKTCPRDLGLLGSSLM